MVTALLGLKVGWEAGSAPCTGYSAGSSVEGGEDEEAGAGEGLAWDSGSGEGRSRQVQAFSVVCQQDPPGSSWIAEKGKKLELDMMAACRPGA